MINDLGGGFAGGRKVKLVLDDLVKQLRFLAVAPVIAAALLKHVCDLLISPPLTGADFPDPLQQLVKIILAELTPVFEEFIIEDKPLDETTGRLLAEWARGDAPLVMPSDLVGLLAEGDAAASMSSLAPLEAFWKARTKAERDAIGRKQLDEWKARVAP